MTEEKQKEILYPFEKYKNFWNDVFHDINFDGIIFICAKTKQEKFFTVRCLARHELCDYLKTFKLIPNMDYYFTINHFLKKKGGVSRRSNNFFASCGVVVDIDIHDNRITAEQIDKTLSSYKAKLDVLIDMEEAFPYHYCIYTGRGLQFVYIYERAINYKLSIMNERMQELILRQHLKISDENPELKLKVDVGTTKKLSGVYRMPGTYNTKAHKHVTLSKTNYPYLDTSRIIDTHGFFDESFLTQTRTYTLNPKFKGSKKRKSHTPSRNQKIISAIYQYQEDGYAKKKRPGHENRNCTCFILIHFLLEVMDYEDTLREIRAFNSRFDVPLMERRLKSMVDYAYENFTNEKKTRMRFLKTSTVIDYLGIEDGEYGIHDTSEERKKIEQERAIRREQKAERDKIICSLFQQGVDYEDIQKQVNCGIRTVNRVIDKNYPRKKEKEKRDKCICNLYLLGMAYSDIAKEIGCSVRTVNNIVAKYYPKESRKKPWEEKGLTKEEYYKMQKMQ